MADGVDVNGLMAGAVHGAEKFVDDGAGVVLLAGAGRVAAQFIGETAVHAPAGGRLAQGQFRAALHAVQGQPNEDATLAAPLATQHPAAGAEIIATAPAETAGQGLPVGGGGVVGQIQQGHHGGPVRAQQGGEKGLGAGLGAGGRGGVGGGGQQK